MEKPGKIYYATLASIIFLVLLTYAVYQGSLNATFFWDDEDLLLKDEQIRSLKNIPEFFTPAYWKEKAPFRGANFRPLRTFSFTIDYFLWGYNAYGYHFTNLFFHIFNVLLVYYFVYLLLQEGPRLPDSPIPRYAPLLSALFFAVHPIHTEAVVWIKNRSELFSTFFFLSSLILLIKSQTLRLNQSSKYYSLSIVCFILSLLSKEVAIALPLILAFYYFFFLPSDGLSFKEKARKMLFKTLPFWAIGIIYIVIRFTLIKSIIRPTEPAPTIDLFSQILLVIKTIGEYLRLLIFPVNLSVERLLGIPKSIFESDMLIFTGAIILLLIGIVLLLRRAKPASLAMGFALFWILITILPAGNIYYLYLRPLAEQRLYLPSVGFCAFLGLMVAKTAVLPQKTSKRILQISFPKPIIMGQVLSVLAAFSVLVTYSSGTIVRIADWQDDVRFWEKTAQLNQDNWRTQMNLGIAYNHAGRIEEGMQRMKQAILLAPETPGIYFDLGNVYEKQGRLEEAAVMFKKGMNLIDPMNTEFYLGRFYQRRSQKEKAIENYKKALDIDPEHGDAHYSLAQIYDNEQQYGQAIFHYEQVIKVEPGRPDIDKVYFNLGRIYRLRGKLDKAITYWERTLMIKPDFIDVRMNLVELYKVRGMYSEAIDQYKIIDVSNSKNWDIYFNIGLLYSKQGLSKEAAESYEKAVKYNPNFAEAHYNLGLLYMKFGRYNEAAVLFQRIMYLDPTNVKARRMYEVALKSAKQNR